MSSKDISLSNRINGDEDSDSHLFGGVMTHYSNRLFQMTSSRDFNIRLAA